jgi:hypothetical protein
MCASFGRSSLQRVVRALSNFVMRPVGCNFAQVAGRNPAMIACAGFCSSRRIRRTAAYKVLRSLGQKIASGGCGSRAGVAVRAPSVCCISLTGLSNVEVDRLRPAKCRRLTSPRRFPYGPNRQEPSSNCNMGRLTLTHSTRRESRLIVHFAVQKEW